MSLTDDLERLARLHAEGHLSADEYARAKERLLAGPSVAGQVGRGLNGLRRHRDDRWLGGVCGGVAVATGLASWIWRLVFLALALCGGTGFVLYGLAWLLVPLAERPLPPSAQIA
jgi:phage shock protein C